MTPTLTYLTAIPPQPADGDPLMVLLHGRGADENDMLALARFFPEAMVVAPRAPFAAAPWGYGPGYAWYRFLGGVRPDPNHFQQSLEQLHTLLEAVPALLPVQPGPLFLGGFSQGGTVGLGYTLCHPDRVHTLLNLSGFLADHPAVQVTPAAVAHTRFYWPHGTLDTNVPYAYAQQGRARLLAANAFLAAPDYPMGHTIVQDEIEDIRELLRTI